MNGKYFMDSWRKLRQHKRAVNRRDKRIISILKSTSNPESLERYSAHHTRHHWDREINSHCSPWPWFWPTLFVPQLELFPNISVISFCYPLFSTTSSWDHLCTMCYSKLVLFIPEFLRFTLLTFWTRWPFLTGADLCTVGFSAASMTLPTRWYSTSYS